MTRLDIHSPLQAAVDQMAARVVAGSPRTAAQWALLPAELRMRLMFSARCEHERTLGEMQVRITDGLAGRKREGVAMDKGRFVEEMREIVRATGYKRPDGTPRKSIQNLKSRARLELIWDMNRAQALGHANWLSDMTPEALENEPCYELVRIEARREPRDWFTVWLKAGGKLYDGRMIAPKTSTIWVAISRFGTPWAPFDWGSGMGLAGVDIDEAESLGAVSPDDAPQEPQETPFNESYQASAASIPAAGRARILTAFQGEAALHGDKFHLIQQSDLAPAVRRTAPALGTLLTNATNVLSNWTENEMKALANVVAKTAAWQRWAAISGTAIFTTGGLARAVAQFLAGPDGKDAIRELRETQARDQFWCPADFAVIGRFLKERGVE
jgi:hypothetical protein